MATQRSFSPLWRFLLLTLTVYHHFPCLAQEYPAYRTPNFDYNVSYRQDVCDRQEAFHNKTVLLRDALQGFELHPWLPLGSFSVLNPDGSINATRPGFPIDILDEVASRAGFTWRNSFGVSNADELDGRTFAELLNWTIQTYDLSAAQWTKTLTRINAGASFPEGWYDSSVIMVGVEESQSKLNVWSFLEPFDWQVWVLIFVTFLVSGFVYLWMEWFNEDSDRQELGNKPTETVYFAMLTATGDVKFQPSTDYARLFTISLCFWSLLMASAYTANLASFLVVQNTPSLNINTVGDAVAANLPMCTLAGSAQDDFVKQAYPGAILVHTDPSFGDKGVFWGVLDGLCTLAITTVGAWDRYQRDGSVNGDCSLTWIGRVFKYRQGGYVTLSDSGTLCTSLIRDVLNLHLLEMEEQGFIDTAYQKALETSGDINCGAASSGSGSSESDLSSHRLSIQDMGGLFIVFYIVAAITVFMALFVKWKAKWKLRRQQSSARLAKSGVGKKADEEVAQQEGSPMEQGDVQTNGANDNDASGEEPETLQKTDMLEKLDNIQRELETMRSLLHSSNEGQNMKG